MPTPNDETRRKCALIKGRFTGDPSHEYEHSEKTNIDDPDKEEETDVVKNFYLTFSLTQSESNGNLWISHNFLVGYMYGNELMSEIYEQLAQLILKCFVVTNVHMYLNKSAALSCRS